MYSQERDISVEKLSYYYNNNLIGVDLYNNVLRSLDTNNIGPHTIIYNVDSVSCHGFCDGVITFDINGPSSPYNLEFNSDTILQVDSVAVFNDLCAGSYSVLITDSLGGFIDFYIIHVEEPANLIILSDSTNVTCYGYDDASIEITPFGDGPFDLSLYNDLQLTLDSLLNFSGTHTFDSLSPGLYYLETYDIHNCVIIDSFVVTEPPPISASLSSSDVSCTYLCDGEAAIDSVFGAYSPFNFIWSNNQNDTLQFGGNDILDSLCYGEDYQVIAIDSIGCMDTVVFNINQPDTLNIEINSIVEACYNVCDGEIQASATGGTGSLYYFFLDNSFNVLDSALSPIAPYTVEDLCPLDSSYFIIVQDNNGCTDTIGAIVNEMDSFNLNLNVVNETCFGDCDGEVHVNVMNPNFPPVSFLWSNGVTDSSIIDLCQDSFILVIHDQMGCYDTLETFVSGPQSPVAISLTTDSVSCFGFCDGAANDTVTGGTPPYSYDWGSFDPNLLCAGNYSLTVTDSVGCQDSTVFNIEEPDEIILNLSDTIGCYNNIDLILEDSTFVSYLWNTGDTTFFINVSQDNLYHVTVVDSDGCVQSDSSVVNILDIEINPNDTIVCFGADVSMNTIITNGGVTNTYLWSNGLSSNNALYTFVSGGNFTVWVEVNDGFNICYDTTTVRVNDPFWTGEFNDVSCFGFNDGSATSTAAGSFSPPYSYDWGVFNPDSLSPGNYYVIVTDNIGCIDSANFTIIEPPQLNSVITATHVDCYGNSTGTASVDITGGVSPYIEDWGQMDPNALSVGIFFVDIIDDNGCILTDSININEPTLLELINLTHTDSLNCYGLSDGFASVDATGGTSPYIFDWNGEDPNNLTAGSYNVYVTDDNGCTESASFNIMEPLEIQINYNISMPLCYGGSDGNIQIDVLNAVGNINYLWNTGANGQNIFNINSGIYHVAVNDENGCYRYSGDIEVTQPDPLDLNFDIFDASCLYSDDGQISLNVIGGTAPYSFLWDNSETTDNIFNLEVGSYDVLVTDYNDCEINGSAFVNYLDLSDCDKIPTIFTPNNDSQYDSWDIGFLSLFPGCNVKIFNRWGQLLFESDGYTEPWDGKYKGNDLPIADYYYIIDLRNGTEALTGTITIIR